MILIPLQTLANQSLSLQLDNNSYDLTIRACNNADAQIMACDVIINNQIIIQGQRVLPDFTIIPYQYLFNGNFIFLTANDEIPAWQQFQISQYLFYVSQDELKEFREQNG